MCVGFGLISVVVHCSPVAIFSASILLSIRKPDGDEMDSDNNAQARVNESMISAFRADMYIPSSPLKG